MGISGGCGGVFVTEQCADNWQLEAVHNADRCKRMPQIMQANITKSCNGSSTRPDAVDRSRRSTACAA